MKIKPVPVKFEKKSPQEWHSRSDDLPTNLMKSVNTLMTLLIPQLYQFVITTRNNQSTVRRKSENKIAG